LSHKTGKRVLTASTTIALAAVGLAAAPLAAHAAAADVTLTNVCGGPVSTMSRFRRTLGSIRSRQPAIALWT